MRATLIFNPNAGSTKGLNAADLQAALAEAGYEPHYEPTERTADLARVLADATGIVVTVGGDGTVRAVASHLVGRGIPVAILPCGTANNIARTLGLEGTPHELIAGLRAPMRRPYDVGRIRAPWGTDYFLEACGFGLYADALAAYDPEGGKSVTRALTAVRNTLGTYVPIDTTVRIDQQDLPGRYLLVEVLNTVAAGPRLQLAPDASTSDGLLDVVCVDDTRRDGLLTYVRALMNGELGTLDSVRVLRGRCVEVEWTGQMFHVDGEVRPAPDEEGRLPPIVCEDGRVEIDVIPGAIDVLLPQPVAVPA